MYHRKIEILALTILLTGVSGCNSARVKDIDGNSYKTVKAGDQTWLKENLKTTRYNDGTPIPCITDNDSWAGLISPAYCWYANDPANKDIYGALYNFHAVDEKKLCPTGWHVPDQADWLNLVNFIGDASIAGNKLKEAGTSHWKSPNDKAEDELGFTALPGGYRSFNGAFSYMWIAGYWWSTTENIQSTAYFWFMRYDVNYIDKFIAAKANGFSVRCVKDKTEEAEQ